MLTCRARTAGPRIGVSGVFIGRARCTDAVRYFRGDCRYQLSRWAVGHVSAGARAASRKCRALYAGRALLDVAQTEAGITRGTELGAACGAVGARGLRAVVARADVG